MMQGLFEAQTLLEKIPPDIILSKVLKVVYAILYQLFQTYENY